MVLPYIGNALSPEPPTAEQVEKWIQEQKDNPEPPVEYISSLNQSGLTNATLGNCFDIYKFNNIDVSVGLDQNEYEPGDIIYMKGELRNKNSYPLPDLKIRAKIVKIEQEENRRIVKTVDEIVLGENINLPSLGNKDIDYKYNIPFEASKGDYEVLLSVTQNNQINIAGLSFTDDVYALNPGFSIKGDNNEEIVIKQKDITVNNNPYDNLSFTPSYTERQAVNIKVPIQNNSDQDKEVEIKYEVYNWSDDLGKIEKELIQQKTIAKQGTSIADYTIEDINKSVYYVKIIVKDVATGTKTRWSNIANIRFTNEYINEPGIVFVGFNTSPFSPEGDLSLVSCIGNVVDIPENATLENIIRDEKGKVIVTSKYEGEVTGQIDGIYTQLPKDKKYNKLLVTSTIKDKDGNILNTVELNYDCTELDPGKCTSTQDNILLIVGIVSGIIILIIGILFGHKRYKLRSIKQ
jgi:hypothetical protein